MSSWLRASALSIAALSLVACRPHALDASTLDARTLHVAAANVAMHAVWYPPTVRVRSAPVPVVVLEPMLFTRDLLTRNDGLVAWLDSEGFGVWLVGPDGAVPPGSRVLGAGIAAMVDELGRQAHFDRLALIAPSLAAPAAMFALDALTSPTTGAPHTQVAKVVFLGGGLDFAYGPRTFAARVAPVRSGPASAMCALDGGTFCTHLLRGDEAAKWLGVLPPADADELAPTNERYPFITRFRGLRALFVAGKADGAAPSESMFRTFEYWGKDEPDSRKVPKVFFLAGRENGFAADDDAFALLAGERAGGEVWERVGEWIRE